MSKNLSIEWICFVSLSVLIAWFLDVMITVIGIRFFGLSEVNPIFLIYPQLWLFIVEMAVLAVALFKWAPLWMRKIFIAFLTIGSFVPAVRNLIIIWMITL